MNKFKFSSNYLKNEKTYRNIVLMRLGPYADPLLASTTHAEELDLVKSLAKMTLKAKANETTTTAKNN